MDYHLLSTHVDPKCAGVAPTHAIESMQTIIDSNLITSFYLATIAVNAASVVAGKRAFDDRRGGMNVVKVNH
jgi:hypothetical protein